MGSGGRRGSDASLPPTVAARSPTGQLNSTCHQDVGRVYLSGVYMYFNLNLCQPAQLTPAAPPHPHTAQGLAREGDAESEASASSLAQLVRQSRALDSEPMHLTHLFCHTANTEAVDPVPDTGAGAGNRMPAAVPSARGQTNLSVPQFPSLATGRPEPQAGAASPPPP